MTPKVTSGGYGAIVRALDGVGLTFTCVKIGNGSYTEQYATLNDLINPLMEMELTDIQMGEQKVTLSGMVSNSEVESSFRWTEVGIYCSNPSGGDDILYAYGHTGFTNESPIEIPPSTSGIVELQQTYIIYVGEVADVSAVLAGSSTYATKENLLAHTKDNNNPHNVTAAQVGLGNVPNKSTNDQTPTYTIASSITKLASGETLSKAFGKLATAVNGLITHLADSVIHITPNERTSWNSKAEGTHTHAASDTTSGTFGVARGGTGKSSWTANRMIYPSGATAFSQLAFPSYARSVLCQDASGSPYWMRAVVEGTYTGTGKSGSSQQNSIYFSEGIPKVILIVQTDYANRWGILFPNAGRGISIVDSLNGDLIVSTSGNTVNWYYNSTESHPANQLDHDRHIFQYYGLM